ncbi:MAG TPA: NADPH-dependent assimilatory sulfite reductase hemoprotein subunit [Candidatus Baltobacteraceae bacterium]|jgi:sulfite reductase (ferredoxin)|nr:NADPH-dependent assimilatory sulfite reductase hemoprotein subunit [Candidatus Baltobacteraceae bacterium]
MEERHLLALGIGNGSKVEAIKLASHGLRGPLVDELVSDATHLTEDSIQLLKFHGSYQQEDRDQRAARRAAGTERAYQFMIRSRIPGGRMSAAQYLVHDDIAQRYGNGTIRLTTRQAIQLHGVLKTDLRSTIHEINASLLSTLAACGDVNRNVMSCPAPLHDRHAEFFEITEKIVHRLAPRTRSYHEIWIDGERIELPKDAAAPPEPEPIYGPTYLPRKFKIAIADPHDNCVDVMTQDIGLIAVLDGDRVAGFTIVVGGGMGTTHNKPQTYARLATPLAFVSPDEAVDVVEAIVTVQRDYGDRVERKHARMKYLIAERGIAWFREQVEARLGRRLADPHPLELRDIDDHLGWHRQPDGRWFLGVFVQSGRIHDAGELRLRTGLADVLHRFEPNLRITGQQNLLLTDVRAEDREPLTDLLRAHGVVVDPLQLGVRRYSMACPAAPTCGLAVAESERALPALVASLQSELDELGLGDERFSLRMTGCPNGCARPFVGDLGIVGRSAGLYDVLIGGDWVGTRLNATLAQSVKTADIIPKLKPLLSRWRDERQSAETFGDWANRIGIEALVTTKSEAVLS